MYEHGCDTVNCYVENAMPDSGDGLPKEIKVISFSWAYLDSLLLNLTCWNVLSFLGGLPADRWRMASVLASEISVSFPYLSWLIILLQSWSEFDVLVTALSIRLMIYDLFYYSSVCSIFWVDLNVCKMVSNSNHRRMLFIIVWFVRKTFCIIIFWLWLISLDTLYLKYLVPLVDSLDLSVHTIYLDVQSRFCWSFQIILLCSSRLEFHLTWSSCYKICVKSPAWLAAGLWLHVRHDDPVASLLIHLVVHYASCVRQRNTFVGHHKPDSESLELVRIK